MAKEKRKELPIHLRICKSVKAAKITLTPRKSKVYSQNLMPQSVVGGVGEKQ